MVSTRRGLCAEPLEYRHLMASVSMPTVDIGPERQVVAGLHIAEATGVRAAEIRIHYDPSALRTNQESIHAGKLWNDKVSVVAKVDEVAGIITAFVYSAEPIDTTAGNLLDISFEPMPCFVRSQAIPIDVQEVRLNEGQITLTDEPVFGPDPTDGEIVTSTRSNRQSSDFRSQDRHQFHGPMRPNDIDAVMQDFHRPLLRQQMIARRRA